MQDYSHELLSLLGLDPAQSPHSLNLAGCDGFPPLSPSQLASPTPMTTSIMPDYMSPDMMVPSIKPYDLQQPGITLQPEWTPDPALPDLDAYNHPYALDFHDGMVPSQVILDHIPSDAEIAASLYPGLGFPMLSLSTDVTEPDPLLPDLQHPQLTPDVEMAPEDRPADMAPGALDSIDDQDEDKDYPSSQMDGSGVNTPRARRSALRNAGLGV